MSLISWVKGLFGGSMIMNPDAMREYEEIVGELCIRELAFMASTNLVANAISKCEFKTYYRGKETKEKEYYLWNVEPNLNQNSSQFIHEWIAKLMRNNECLIVERNGQLLVADDFLKSHDNLNEDIFSDVRVNDYTFNRNFRQSEVLYFKFAEDNARKVMLGIYNSYSKLIAYSMKYYQRSRGSKVKFKYDTLPVKGTAEEENFNKLLNVKIKTFLEADSSAIPLGRGQDLTEFGSNKTYSSEGTRDIRAMIDDIFEFTAKAYGIPSVLVKGEVQGTSDAVDNLLTFCVDGLTDMFSEEINRKRNGYKEFSRGTYLSIDTKSIKHVDLLSVSSAIEKLISSGTFCINDIRKLVGEPTIDEPWAYQHFITKNFMPFEEALSGLKGGENN